MNQHNFLMITVLGTNCGASDVGINQTAEFETVARALDDYVWLTEHNLLNTSTASCCQTPNTPPSQLAAISPLAAQRAQWHDARIG